MCVDVKSYKWHISSYSEKRNSVIISLAQMKISTLDDDYDLNEREEKEDVNE